MILRNGKCFHSPVPYSVNVANTSLEINSANLADG